MKKHYLIFLSIFFIAAVLLVFFFINSSWYSVIFDKMETISDDISQNLRPQFEEINDSIASMNDQIEKISEEYQNDIIEKINESVVMVVAYPPLDNDDNKASIIYTDSKGKSGSVGTGFSINQAGHILTAKHVVQGADNIKVILKDGTELEVSGYTDLPEADIALLIVDTKLPPVEFIENGTIPEGSQIGFIGFPLVEVRTKTLGYISALTQHSWDNNKLVNTYVINSFVNKGNSGGPVFSVRTGKVIGMINAIYDNKNGFAISTVITKKVFAPGTLN